MSDDVVTISRREYEQLLSDSDWLACLEAAGVDNWEGFDIARDILREEAGL